MSYVCASVSNFKYNGVKCYFWSVFCCIRIEYGDLFRKSPYSHFSHSVTNGLSNSKSFWKHKQYLNWIFTEWDIHSPAPVCFCALFSKLPLPIQVNALSEWSSSGNLDKMFKEYLWKSSFLSEVKGLLPATFCILLQVFFKAFQKILDKFLIFSCSILWC